MGCTEDNPTEINMAISISPRSTAASLTVRLLSHTVTSSSSSTSNLRVMVVRCIRDTALSQLMVNNLTVSQLMVNNLTVSHLTVPETPTLKLSHSTIQRVNTPLDQSHTLNPSKLILSSLMCQPSHSLNTSNRMRSHSLNTSNPMLPSLNTSNPMLPSLNTSNLMLPSLNMSNLMLPSLSHTISLSSLTSNILMVIMITVTPTEVRMLTTRARSQSTLHQKITSRGLLKRNTSS